MKAKELKQKLLQKENDILRDAMLYCADHSLHFSREHNKLMRVAIRKFFETGIYPLIRDLTEVNIKDYHND